MEQDYAQFKQENQVIPMEGGQVNEVVDMASTMESPYKTNFLTSRIAKNATRNNLRQLSEITGNLNYKTML